MKKSFVLCVISIILSAKTIYAKPLFQIERLATDYNGVIETNDRIIVYGNNGILTYTDDFGKNWKQINLGEFNHIIKILKDKDENLYALAPRGILFSKDAGNAWTLKTLQNEETMLDFTLKNDTFYLITKNVIWILDKNLNSQPQIYLQFDEFTSFSKCELLENYLFVVESMYYIYRIDLTTKEIDTIDIHNGIGSNYRDLEQIKVIGSTIYALVKSSLASNIEFAYSNLRHLVMRSTDLGKNWEIVTSNLPVTLDFFIDEEGSVATLAPICFYLGKNDPYFGFSFIKAKKNEFSEFIQTDTDNVWLPYYFPVNMLNKYKINSIIKLKDNLLVAVGNDKIILLSYDNGLKWELKSFFRPLFSNILGELKYNVQVFGKDTIIVVSNTKPYCFYSTDGGATFLPILRSQVIQLEKNLSLRVPILFLSGTFGFIGYKTGEVNKKVDTLILMYSKDFGKTFIRVEHPFGYITNNDSINHILFIRGCFLKEIDEFLIGIFIVPQFNNYSGPKFILYRIDNKFNFVDTIFLNFFLFGLLPYSKEVIFSDGTFFYKSTDFGKTLYTISKFPRASYTKNQNDYLNNFFLGALQNQLLIFESTPISNRLLKFDLKTNSFDSLDLEKVDFPSLIFLNDTVILTTENKVYIFQDIQKGLKDFSIHPIDSIVSDRTLISGFITNEMSEILLILQQVNKSQTGFLETFTPLNLAKLVYHPTYLKIEPELETNFTYLYAFPPFPNPAEDWVETQVFWDCMQRNNKIDINIFDIFGRNFNIPFEIFPAGNCSSIVRFKTSLLPMGMYYITFKLGTKNLTLPFVLIRH